MAHAGGDRKSTILLEVGAVHAHAILVDLELAYGLFTVVRGSDRVGLPGGAALVTRSD